jgi:hypothetical protein
MPKLDDITIPYTLMGQVIAPSNEVRGQVVQTILQTGQNPLEGTGLAYGANLTYSVEQDSGESPAALDPGTPAQPNTIPFKASDPYPGFK